MLLNILCGNNFFSSDAAFKKKIEIICYIINVFTVTFDQCIFAE